MPSRTVDDLTRRVLAWHDSLPWTAEFGVLLPPVLAELGEGEPVEPARIAARAGMPVDDVLDFLRRSPSEWDSDGRLVGFGLTLRPTRHRFEVDGRTFFAWCAPDTLAFPVLLKVTARVESPCFASGEPIRIELAPDGVRAVEPEGAVVSVVTPKIDLPDLRRRLCHHQHFFRSAEAAADWKAAHPEGLVLSVGDGFELMRRLAEHWFKSRAGSAGGDEQGAA